MNLKNFLGGGLLLLLLFTVFAGFGAFRVSQQMVAPVPQAGQSRLGPVQTPAMPFGKPFHNCRGRLLLNRKVSSNIKNPVITLLDNKGADLEQFEVVDPTSPDFWVKVPEGNQGLVRFDADGVYTIQTLIEQNIIVSLHDAATFSGTVKGHAFVLRGEKLPDPTPPVSYTHLRAHET